METKIGTSWHSYPKIYNLGHEAIRGITHDECIVEEKIDGSQFSFGVFDGELKCRSKGKQLVLDSPEKMFQNAVDCAIKLKGIIRDGWTYRGEYLQKPKHNTLAYDRTPTNGIIIFDINDGEESYLSPDEKWEEAHRIGLECVPVLTSGRIEYEQLNEILSTKSVLGGVEIEGVVIKQYKKFGRDGKCLFGKHVSEKFKEVHKADWKARNKTNKDVVTTICESLRTEARWEKAVQHLREAGELEWSPRDIGKLIKEVPRDLKDECEAEVKDKLFKQAWPQIARKTVAGLPEWYKEKLMKRQFDGGDESK